LNEGKIFILNDEQKVEVEENRIMSVENAFDVVENDLTNADKELEDSLKDAVNILDETTPGLIKPDGFSDDFPDTDLDAALDDVDFSVFMNDDEEEDTEQAYDSEEEEWDEETSYEEEE